MRHDAGRDIVRLKGANALAVFQAATQLAGLHVRLRLEARGDFQQDLNRTKIRPSFR